MTDNIKPTDLMLDDWVFIAGSKPFKINSIYLTDQFERVQETDDVDAKVESLQPIPLTAEILEQNDFSRCRVARIDEWRFLCGNVLIILSTTERDKNIGGFHLTICVDGGDNQELEFALDMRCFYVHQLQHAMRLANIEKEVEL